MRISVAVVPVLLVALAACGAEPPTIGPTGVDELVIPTPDPDPADFVEGVDNPWLPLVPGRVWRYAASGGDGVHRIEVTVLEETRTVDDVVTTPVRTEVSDEDGRTLRESQAWFAQDSAGNVWQLAGEGAEGTWQAGVAGARAGLAMPAEPRVGDGFRVGYASGVFEKVAEVLAVDASASVPFGQVDEVVVTDVRDPLAAGATERREYARDVGLVRIGTPTEVAELVAVVG